MLDERSKTFGSLKHERPISLSVPVPLRLEGNRLYKYSKVCICVIQMYTQQTDLFAIFLSQFFFLMNLKCVYTSTSYFEVVHTLTVMTLPRIILSSTFVTVSQTSTCFQNVDAP